MFVVTVMFRTDPAHADRFLPAILDNAARSLAREPGCQRFDVCTGVAGEVFLYELYTDEAAFEAHKAMAHFRDFSALTEPWVTEKTVHTYTLANAAA